VVVNVFRFAVGVFVVLFFTVLYVWWWTRPLPSAFTRRTPLPPEPAPRMCAPVPLRSFTYEPYPDVNLELECAPEDRDR
jgi:hypothetical protein